jgi:hypothetical protein
MCRHCQRRQFHCQSLRWRVLPSKRTFHSSSLAAMQVRQGRLCSVAHDASIHNAYVMMAGTTQSSRSLTKSPTACTWTKGNTQQQGQRRLQEVMQVAVVQQNMRLRELWSASDVPWRRLCQAVQHQRMGGCFYPHAQSLPASAAREHMAWHVLPGEQRRWQQHQHEYQYNPLNSNPECIVSCILYLIHYTHNAHLIYLYTYNLVPCSHPHPHRQPHAHPQTRTQPPGSSRVLWGIANPQNSICAAFTAQQLRNAYFF